MTLYRRFLRPLLMRLMPNCRQVTEWLLLAEERPPSPRERLMVAIHMPLCAACPRFRRQVDLMRKASAGWRRYSEDEGLE
jgi:hypothetical protein